MIDAIFYKLCPNCGNTISSKRTYGGYLCSRCSPEPGPPCDSNLKHLKRWCDANNELKNWIAYFERYEGITPWSLQRFWAKRVFLGKSFSMLAPTGIGKSTFGISMAAYLSQYGKTAIIVPTRLLVQQTLDKLKKYGVSVASSLDKSSLSKPYDVLVITHMFLYKNIDTLPKNFKYVFVDDVDSFLKSARNVDKLLMLVGFSKSDIATAFKVLKGELSEEYLIPIKKKPHGVVNLASATSKPKSIRVNLFRLLLDFEVGRPKFYLRNVEDLYDYGTIWNWLPILGKKGLIFGINKEQAKTLYEELSEKGYRAAFYEDITSETIELFKKGEIDVLVGVASYRNPLSRGLDIVETRYALFAGVPRIEFDLTKIQSPTLTLLALNMLRSIVPPELTKDIDYYINLIKSSQSVPEEIIELFKSLIPWIKRSSELTLTPDLKIIFADVVGYLQASGRTSRMYPGGIAKGLSLLLVDDERAFLNLKRRITWYAEVEFKKAEKNYVLSLLKEIDREREKISQKAFFDPIKPVFVIVESPNKARTIANFFGKPIKVQTNNAIAYEFITGSKYVVITASLGHILDLIKNKGYHGTIVENSIIPIYEKLEDKIDNLRDFGKQAFSIYVATDPDTEGEKIAWDLYNMLRVFTPDIKRMEFHEITKKAVINALEHPRDVNENLVKAQIVRRIADRWVGFELSQLLQKTFRRHHLSSGRVQTPVLGWIVKREQEAKQKKYIIILDDWDLETHDKSTAESIYKKGIYTIKILDEKITSLNPKPPYTTDQLLKDAHVLLKLTPQKTMELAQDLFELGIITYHRTDSIHVSETGRYIAKQYLERNQLPYHLRSWGPEGTHEAIRPTKPLDMNDLKSYLFVNNIKLSDMHIALYDIIFRRFMASQMPPATVKQSIISIIADPLSKTYNLITDILEKGFSHLWTIEKKFVSEGTFKASHKQIKTVPKVPRYTYATLIEDMKNRGIGRPSTYAITVEKLLERKYIKDVHGTLYPTKLGIKIYTYLSSLDTINEFISEEFTRILESYMDEVETGARDYQEILFMLLDKIKNGMARI